MNPGGAESERWRSEAQRHPDRQFGQFQGSRSSQGAPDDESVGRSLAGQIPRLPGRTAAAHSRRSEHLGLDAKAMDRCKNFFSLGMCYWLYNRSMEPTSVGSTTSSRRSRCLVEANKLALKAGYSYCEATEAFQISYEIPPAQLSPGFYRNLSGNQALALGFVTAAKKAGLKLFLGSLSHHTGVGHSARAFTLQGFRSADLPGRRRDRGHHVVDWRVLRRLARDHHHFGPRHGVEDGSLGLAVMTELPLVICDIQRGGPSTGLPTKTEQADLLQALFGRNSEAPIPVLAPATPGDCFWVAVEASRIALKYMVPVIILSDGYLANGAEPWRIPAVDEIPSFPVQFAKDPEGFLPYKRNPDTLARPWAVPGTPGLEHRIGGLEKQDVSGNVNYEPLNHENMVRIRAAKIDAIVQDVPNVMPTGDPEGDLLIVSWGSTFGAITRQSKGSATRGVKSGTFTCVISIPFRATWATSSNVTRGSSCRNSTWDSFSGFCAPSIWSTPSASTRFRAVPSSKWNSIRRSRKCWDSRRTP